MSPTFVAWTIEGTWGGGRHTSHSGLRRVIQVVLLGTEMVAR